jgi:hypothetical protein
MKDITFDCPECGKSLTVDERGAGLTVLCPECSKTIHIPKPSTPPPLPPPPAAKPESPPPGPFKVVSLNDQNFLGGKFSPEAVEEKLNQMASDGWMFKDAATVRWPNWLGTEQQQVLLIFEKHEHSSSGD